MQNDQVNLIDKMFAYNLWANTQLIEICRTLTPEQLEIEVDGVFGKIRPTLVHLIQAEGFYVNRLTGSSPWADAPNWEAMSVSDLPARAKLSGQHLLDIASKADPATRHVVEYQGTSLSFFNWTVLLQALYHGIEHRTQIKMMLTHLGVDHPDLAAWDFAGIVWGNE